MAEMKRLLAEALSHGAIGFSTGLIYPPGIYSSTEELTGLSRYGREVSAGPFVYTSHMRSESAKLIESIEETISIGRGAGAGVHISHVKTAGRENWHKADAAIALMDDARNKGVRVTCDRYPYTAASTDLDAVLPRWAFEGGSEEEIKRLKDPAQREKIKAELSADDAVWEGVVISSVPGESGRWLEGLSIKEVAKRKNLGCRDALLDVLLEQGLRVGAVFHGMSEENLWKFLSLPYAMVGSDSAARSFGGPTASGKPHPRGFGSFPRFLKNYPGGLSEAIRKATGLPAETFGMVGRGLIREGFKADIVVFDPGRLKDRATYEEPFQKPGGILHVIINGVPAVLDGKSTGRRSGRILRGGV
jgi:N-acyl-D-amino-acid deacylase